MNRLRIRFKRGDEVKFISHLDLIRLWQRALRRAGIMLAYSEGFNPHPKLSLAAPLALGVTAESELMDIYVVQPISPHAFTAMVGLRLPLGVEIAQVYPVSLDLPSLQSQVHWAEYLVGVSVPSEDDVGLAIVSLVACEHFPWQHQRDTGTKSYDLRKLIDRLWLASYADGVATIGMKLRCDSEGSGRPEQVVKALGLDMPLDIHRTKLILSAGQ